jgi:putative MATE family efflux protein
MKDLTQGSLRGHLLTMALPMVIGMSVQMLYYLVDLYFVGQLGAAALAGVSAAGSATLIVLALTQVLSVGTVATISQAVGARQSEHAAHLFRQSLLLGAVGSLLILLLGYGLARPFMQLLAGEAHVAQLGTTYLYWFLPGLALQCVLTAIGSALRGNGVAQPAMVVQLVTVLLNMVLAPALITGWGSGHALGVAGAGLASSIAVAAGVLLLLRLGARADAGLGVRGGRWHVDAASWRRMLKIGLPAGGEYLLMFLFSAYVYYLLRGFGETAQAGFGVGARVMQVIFLPAAAIGFAVPAVAGQNFGAGLGERVRGTLQQALILEGVIMLVLTAWCQVAPMSLLGWSNATPAVQEFAMTYLHYMSWNFLAAGTMFACSGLFQAVGNTMPTLACAALRLFTFVAPLLYLSGQPHFAVTHIWTLSILSTLLQAIVGLWLAYRVLTQQAARPALAAAA